MQLSSTCRCLVLVAAFANSSAAMAGIDCPEFAGPVTQVSRDVKVEVDAAAGALGKLKAVELGAKVTTNARALYERFPNMDKVVLTQTLMATYCRMLVKANLSDTERLARWEAFQDKILGIPLPTSSAVPQAPTRKLTSSSATSTGGTPRTAPPAPTAAPRRIATVETAAEPVQLSCGDLRKTKLMQQAMLDRSKYILPKRTMEDWFLQDSVPASVNQNPEPYRRGGVYHIVTDTEEAAKEVLQKFAEGECWSVLAKLYSTDQSTRERTGEFSTDGTGYIWFEQLPTEVANTARRLRADQYSSTPVRSSAGWHVIAVTGKQ